MRKQEPIFPKIGNILPSFFAGLIQSGMFVSRLPLARLAPTNSTAITLGNLVGYFPVWGAILAVICCGLVLPLLWLGMPMPALALLVVMLMIVLTGALHEDGLADCLDGWFGGKDTEQRLLIMKDSRLGSYGTLGLIFSILMRVFPLAMLSPSQALLAFLVSHSTPRGLLGLFWFVYPTPNKISLAEEKPEFMPMASAILFAVLSAVIFLPTSIALSCLVLSALGMWGMALMSMRKIGGINGDAFGAIEQIGEIIILWVVLAFAYRGNFL